MKKISILSVALILAGCSGMDKIHESRLYVTKKYAGNFVRMVPQKHCTAIITTEAAFYILGTPALDIPAGARCYCKYSPESRAGTLRKFWVLYFTWDGTNDMYMIKQNPYTGKIY
jgi:hypothetical protein